jgi:hypothetical protein
MEYPATEALFADYHQGRDSDIWDASTLGSESGSGWGDDHLHAFRVLFKDNLAGLQLFAGVHDVAKAHVEQHMRPVLAGPSYEELRKLDPRDMNHMPAGSFFRALAQVFYHLPTTADLEETALESRPRRSVKQPTPHGFRSANLTDEAWDELLGPPSPDRARTRLSPATGGVHLPKLVGKSSDVPRSLKVYSAATDQASSSEPPAVSSGKKRPHHPSSDYSQDAASSEKSSHDEKVQHESVTTHAAIHFVQLVFDAMPRVSKSGAFEVTPHQEPFATRFGDFKWNCVNDGCTFFSGWLYGRWDVLCRVVFVSFELKSRAKDGQEGEDLREKTIAERLGQNVSELLAMLGQRLKLVGITAECRNLEERIEELPEHVRT